MENQTMSSAPSKDATGFSDEPPQEADIMRDIAFAESAISLAAILAALNRS